MHSQIYKALLLQVFSVNLFDFLDWWKMLERSWKSLCFMMLCCAQTRTWHLCCLPPTGTFIGEMTLHYTFSLVINTAIEPTELLHTQHYTPALSGGFTCMCLKTFDSRLKGVKHDPFIPLWIKRECWCQQFYSDNSGDADPLSENASIESGTPRYFQADNLYRIAVTEVVYEHHFL